MTGGADQVAISKKRLDSLVTSVTRIARGNLDKKVIRLKDGDELSKLASSLESLRKNLLKKTKSTSKVVGKSFSVEEKVQELEKMNKLMIGRELKMVELKEEIKKLKEGKSALTNDKVIGENLFTQAIYAEEELIRKLYHHFHNETMNSNLNAKTKEKSLNLLGILVKDSERHEKMFTELSDARK